MVFNKWKISQDWSLQRHLRILVMVLWKQFCKEKYSLLSVQLSLCLFSTKKKYQNTYWFRLLKIKLGCLSPLTRVVKYLYSCINRERDISSENADQEHRHLSSKTWAQIPLRQKSKKIKANLFLFLGPSWSKEKKIRWGEWILMVWFGMLL